MAWLVPENMLDDQQRDFVENVDINQKNVWIKGVPWFRQVCIISIHYEAYQEKQSQRQGCCCCLYSFLDSDV